MSKNESGLKLTKVTNMKRGLDFVKTAVATELMDMEDTKAGIKIENVLCVSNLQRYLAHPRMAVSVDIATLAGDMFAAIVHLSEEVDRLKVELASKETTISLPGIDPSTLVVVKPSSEQRIAALEENLRCLRASLTYDEDSPGE